MRIKVGLILGAILMVLVLSLPAIKLLVRRAVPAVIPAP